MIFDYYSSSDFKFAVLDINASQVLIGHRTNKGWFIDASADVTISAGIGYKLGVSMLGTSVSVSLDNQAVCGYVFNALLNDGDIGLVSRNDSTTFDDTVARGDDPAYKDSGDALMAYSVAQYSEDVNALVSADLEPIQEGAKARWRESKLLDATQLSVLDTVDFVIADLEGLTLGFSSGTAVRIDVNAAGHGWFVDATPYDDEEFVPRDYNVLVLEAITGSEAAGRMDLLTVVMHELGHVLGFEHTAEEGVMAETLDVGVRYLMEEPVLPRPVVARARSSSAFSNSAYRSFLRLFDRESDQSAPIWFFQNTRRSVLRFGLGEYEQSEHLIL